MANEKHSVNIDLKVTDQISETLTSYSKAFSELGKNVANTQSHFEKFNRPISDIEDAIAKTNIKLSKFESKLKVFRGYQGPQAGSEETYYTGRSTPKRQRQTSEAKPEKSQIISDHIGKFAVVGATGAAVKSIAGTGASFEESMQNVEAFVSDAYLPKNKEDLENFIRSEAKRLPGYYPREVAAAAATAGTAGYDTRKVKESIPTALEYALGGRYNDPNEAISHLLGIMGGYNKTSSDLKNVADKITHITSLTQTSMRMVSEAMTNFGASAKISGIDLSASLAMTGAVAKSGLVGAPAGTAIRAMIREIENKAGNDDKEAVKIYKKAGLNKNDILTKEGKAGETYFDESGKITGNRLFKTIKTLIDAKLTPAEINKLFGDEGGSAFSKIQAFGIDNLRNIYLENTINSSGSLAKRREILSEGSTPSLKRLGSSIEDLEIGVSKLGLLDLISNISNKVSDFLDYLGEDKGSLASAAATGAGTLSIGGQYLAAKAGIMVMGWPLTLAGAAGGAAYVYRDELKQAGAWMGKHPERNKFPTLYEQRAAEFSDKFKTTIQKEKSVEKKATLKIEFPNMPTGTVLEIDKSPEFSVDIDVKNGIDFGD